MKHYLIVWGESAHAVRGGDGNEESAAKEAFGVYQPERQTIMQISLSALRSDSKRCRFIARELLPAHARKMANRQEDSAANFALVEARKISAVWQKEWDRNDQRIRANQA